MAATVGAGTTSGFYSASGVFSSYRVNTKALDDNNVKYKVVFTRRAFKQGIQEQKMHEYEYLKMRRRAYWQKRRKSENDEYKKASSALMPWGIVCCFVGFLACCTGFVVEWAATFPLGDLTPWMFWCRIAGIALLLTGIIILTASKLIYSARETGTWQDPYMPYKVITKKMADARKSELSPGNSAKVFSNLSFYLATIGLVACVLFFCVGFINGWAETYPGAKITQLERDIAGYLGIWGTAFCIFVMMVSDSVHVWIVNHIELKQPKNPHHICEVNVRNSTPRPSISAAVKSARSSSIVESHPTNMVMDIKDTNPIAVADIDVESDCATAMQQVRFQDVVQFSS